MAIIQIKRGLQEAVGRLSLAQGELAVALDTGNVYIGTSSGNVHINPTGGTADSAEKLKTPRNFSVLGDASAPAVSFDGTNDVSLNLTLSDVAGLTACMGCGLSIVPTRVPAPAKQETMISPVRELPWNCCIPAAGSGGGATPWIMIPDPRRSKGT